MKTTASVHLGKDDKGFLITRIDLVVDATVPGVDDATFQEHAAQRQDRLHHLAGPGRQRDHT